jgi:hypothetical protein
MNTVVGFDIETVDYLDKDIGVTGLRNLEGDDDTSLEDSLYMTTVESPTRNLATTPPKAPTTPPKTPTPIPSFTIPPMPPIVFKDIRLPPQMPPKTYLPAERSFTYKSTTVKVNGKNVNQTVATQAKSLTAQTARLNPDIDVGMKKFKDGKRQTRNDTICTRRHTLVYITALSNVSMTIPATTSRVL